MSSSSPVLHFGLGQVPKVDSLKIRWPDGKVQVLYELAADRVQVLDQEEASIPLWQDEGTGRVTPLFSPMEVNGLDVVHREDPYSDLDREKLIPHSLSAEGPALAVADVNGDGLDDLFVGGARGQAGQILVQNASGEFNPLEVPQLPQDAGQVLHHGRDVNQDFSLMCL